MHSSALIIPDVVRQHAAEASMLHACRAALLRAADAQLWSLRRLDDRIHAHLDGLSVAGALAESICRDLLLEGDPGDIFVLAVRALESGRSANLDDVFDLVGAAPALRSGLLAALGWVSSKHLRGVVVELLRSQVPLHRLCGIAAAAMHRVDPDVSLRLEQETDPATRRRLYRVAGELGRRELVSFCARVADEDTESQDWAAWSAVLLGDRESALQRLGVAAFRDGSIRCRAFQLALQTAKVEQAHATLQARTVDDAHVRVRIQGAGYIGDPRYIPWLIGQIADEKLARSAGAAFSLVTGVDLWQSPYFRQPPEAVESGPTDDPADPNVAMDEDDGLPWPDQAKVQAWWSANGSRFTAGVRHFMGQPPSREHCINVMKTGYQRQRIAAAYHLCLLNPGTPLFEWRAPAWRQQRELAQMA